MKVWIRNHRRSAVLVGITLMLPVYFFLAVMGNLLGTRSEYLDQIEGIEPRVARMQGLIMEEGALRTSLADISTVVSGHVYPSSSTAEAVAASLQAEARRILADSGLEVTNSQVLRPRKRDQFDYIAVKVVARGTLAQLDQSLAELSLFRPVLFVEALDTFPNRRRRKQEQETQVLTVSMQLLSLRSVL